MFSEAHKVVDGAPENVVVKSSFNSNRAQNRLHPHALKTGSENQSRRSIIISGKTRLQEAVTELEVLLAAE